MNKFFTPADSLDKIISDTLPDKKILESKHILTGWTNIVIEVTTDKGAYFFRFPRNPFWSKMIVKDAAVCNFVDGKTSYYTPQMKLCYDAKGRPFSVHEKIEGYTLGDRIYHLSHTAITGVAYDVAKFIKELSKIDLKQLGKLNLYDINTEKGSINNIKTFKIDNEGWIILEIANVITIKAKVETVDVNNNTLNFSFSFRKYETIFSMVAVTVI